jgi:hypothetical protein
MRIAFSWRGWLGQLETTGGRFAANGWWSVDHRRRNTRRWIIADHSPEATGREMQMSPLERML